MVKGSGLFVSWASVGHAVIASLNPDAVGHSCHEPIPVHFSLHVFSLTDLKPSSIVPLVGASSTVSKNLQIPTANPTLP